MLTAKQAPLVILKYWESGRSRRCNLEHPKIACMHVTYVAILEKGDQQEYVSLLLLPCV